MSVVGSQLSVLMIWREKKGHIFGYDDRGHRCSCTGAQFQSQAPRLRGPPFTFRQHKFNCKIYTFI